MPFPRYSQFFIFHKNPRWPPKLAKIEIFLLGTGYPCSILQVKKLLKITQSLTISGIFSMFYFPLKSKMAEEKVMKSEILPEA